MLMVDAPARMPTLGHSNSRVAGVVPLAVVVGDDDANMAEKFEAGVVKIDDEQPGSTTPRTTAIAAGRAPAQT